VIEPLAAPLSEREFDRGLWRMVLVSGALHIVAIVVLLLLPYSMIRPSRPLTSYTVDLVAADKVGGTNLVPGNKGRVDSPPMVAARPAPKVEPPPAPPKVEKPPEPKPAEEAKPPEPKPEPQKAEPPKEVESKPEPPPPPVEVKPVEAPKPPEAKPKEPPKPKEEPAVAQKVEKVVPPAAPSAPKSVPSPKVVAKAEPPKAAPAAPSKADAAAAKQAAAAQERDQRILAAVKRVEQQTGARGGGTGQKPGDKPGGPVSVGPGQGAGGQFMGLEYILYYNALRTRLRDNWAWAGSDAKLEAVIHFGITENGDVVGVRITQSSGDASFDHSVERAVKAINPMPPPPEAHRKEFADVEWTFNLQEMHE